MNYHGKCEHCGDDIYASGEDQWWVCTGCGCVWRVDGVLLRRGEDIKLPRPKATRPS